MVTVGQFEGAAVTLAREQRVSSAMCTCGARNVESVRKAFLVAVTASLSACETIYPRPHAPDPGTNKYLCPTTRPSELTALVPLFAALAAVLFYEASQPPPAAAPGCMPMPDCSDDGVLGAPCCTQPNSGAARSLAWFSVVAGSVSAVAAVASWSEYAHCARLDDAPVAPAPIPRDERRDEVPDLTRTAIRDADAGECDAVRSIPMRVRVLDPVYYANVFLSAVGACISH